MHLETQFKCALNSDIQPSLLQWFGRQTAKFYNVFSVLLKMLDSFKLHDQQFLDLFFNQVIYGIIRKYFTFSVANFLGHSSHLLTVSKSSCLHLSYIKKNKVSCGVSRFSQRCS
jgi:hypothetical protein